jgi:hypothetical protein
LYRKLNNNIADKNLFFLMVKNAVGNLLNVTRTSFSYFA